ncbi:MAG: nucleotide sugar dehydrogenase [Acidobacteriaceae bacterium]|nr:nucleotide sugar dehydrogenase [Acidobacteriaceae bacterium]
MGYIGCVTAACLAKLGHRVFGVDRDAHKVDSVNMGRAPFYEPGLEQLVEAAVAAGTLTATTSLDDGLREAEIALVCVGTPSERNGNLGLGQLRRVIGEIAELMPRRSKPLIVAIRSTVFPGTCEQVVIPLVASFPQVQVVSNPEFLREGIAVQDFEQPSLVVVGGSDATAVKQVAGIYAPLEVEPCLVSLRTAEMIKYACNAFHAVKISFANEVGALCHKLDIDAAEVMNTLCADTRLNISKAYLKPGFAFGGSCLPKDLRALTYRANHLDLNLPLLGSAMPSNDAHLRRAIEAVLDLPSEKIGVVGLAFKENTDDLRESPVVTMLEHLIGKGRNLRVFDPHIRIEEIYGSNKNYILEQIPHISRLMEKSLDALLTWADHLVIVQKQSAAASEKIQEAGLPVLDLVGTAVGKHSVAVHS